MFSLRCVERSCSERTIADDRAREMAEDDPFSCPVCLEALRHPVTIPCGHNYCMSCIKDYWQKHGSEDAGYRCPQCRKSFSPRPVLNKNTMFAEVVERFKNTGLQDPPASRYYKPGPTQRENSKYSKTCLEREDSCCKTHLRYYNNDFPREKHTVIVVSGEPRGNACFWPNRYSYCGTDHQVICPPRLDEARRGWFPPEKTKTLDTRMTLVPHAQGSKDRTNGRDRRQEQIHGTGHRSGQTRGSHAQRGNETHRRSGHAGKPQGHGHNTAGHRRRLGVLVMAGTGPQRTFLDKIRAL